MLAGVLSVPCGAPWCLCPEVAMVLFSSSVVQGFPSSHILSVFSLLVPPVHPPRFPLCARARVCLACLLCTQLCYMSMFSLDVRVLFSNPSSSL